MTPLASGPLDLARALIRCPSVTPQDAGALDILESSLEELGFECHRLTFSHAGTPDVANLYARIGNSAPNFCFAGHTDVVPVGHWESWTVDPFSGEVTGGKHQCQQCHPPHNAPPGFGAAWWSRCNECHRDKVESVKLRGPRHSECKNCHQPHRFAIPTCTSCHTDKTTAWAADAMRHWPDQSPWRQ